MEWNSKAEIVFGFTREEIKGKTLTETIIPPQYREAHLKGMKRFLSSGSGPILNKTVEVTALHKSGREFYINLSISNVKIDDRWIFIAFLSDISERKKTEEQLIKKEAELMQSKLMEEEKDKFISIASHELKTPITTIKAYTQLILEYEEVLPQDSKKYLSKIEQFTNKLTFLLNELLDVSKINQGQLHLSKGDIHFDDFLQDSLNSLQQITPKHSIVLEENAKIIVNADAIRLEQVITNLISNAAKYSPGKDKIIVRSCISESQLVVSIADNGIGIAAENREKIFQRFYRVKGIGSDFNGFGIGLYVSSEIIKQHGGRMWVESKEKEGSTFYFSLPL
jgi:PAS domain S-box-containing protein